MNDNTQMTDTVSDNAISTRMFKADDTSTDKISAFVCFGCQGWDR